MNVLCSATPCPVILNSTCVFYEGANLLYIGVNTNDSIQTALEKINYSLSNFSAPDLQSVTDVGATTNKTISFTGGIITSNISGDGDVLILAVGSTSIEINDFSGDITVEAGSFNLNCPILADNIQAGQYTISNLNPAPATSTSTGILGEIRYTAGFIYVCIAANTWRRTALTAW
jgi:hypothetical protein